MAAAHGAGVSSPPMDDARWMRVALDEAERAASHQDVPVGCVIVSADGSELARGRNRRELDQDPTAHAEIVALRAAARKIGHWRVEDATLFVTLEPCAMCAGALVSARVPRVVYGASDPKAGAVHSKYAIGMDGALNHRFDVTSGVRATESAALLRAFFARLRADGQK